MRGELVRLCACALVRVAVRVYGNVQLVCADGDETYRWVNGCLLVKVTVEVHSWEQFTCVT